MNNFISVRFFALVLFLFIFLETKAQSDFRPGYIITLQDDTIKGLINYRSDNVNTKNCIFKKENDQEKVTYTPDQIKSYRFIDGKYYISSNSLNHQFGYQVFVEYIIKGPVSLFYYKDGDKGHYMVSKDTMIVELDYQERTGASAADNPLPARPQLYKRQLKFLMQDQPSLFPKIDRMVCSTKDLISLLNDYQQLSSPSQENLQFEKKTLKDVTTKVGVFFSAGLSYLNTPPYNMYKSDYEMTKSLDFSSTFTYSIGAMVNFNLNFIGENKYALQLSPALNFVEYTSYTERTLYPLLYSYKTDIKYTTLRIPLMFKYSFYRSNRSVLPFFKFGPGGAMYLNRKGTYEYRSAPLMETSNPEKVYTESLNTNYGSKPIIPYFTAGAGIDTKFGKSLLSIGVLYEYEFSKLEGYRSDGLLQIGLQF